MSSKNKKSKNKIKVRVFGAGNKVITDERFALAEKDPRFQDVPKHKNKVAIDSRFSRMFTDKNFSTSSTRVDKRGKAKQDGNSSQNALKQYYRIDEYENKSSSDNDDSNAEKLNKNVREKMSEPILESDSESSGEEEEELEEDEEELIDDSTSTDTDEDDEFYVEEETEDVLQVSLFFFIFF